MQSLLLGVVSGLSCVFTRNRIYNVISYGFMPCIFLIYFEFLILDGTTKINDYLFPILRFDFDSKWGLALQPYYIWHRSYTFQILKDVQPKFLIF